MAEIFGVVVGTLSVAALFNNAVDCFEYIQLGRNFGRDYETCQLRLDIARLRLSRWGAAVAVHDDPRFAEAHPADDQVRTAKFTLEQILSLFGRAHNESSGFKLTARVDELALFDPATNTNQVLVGLQNSMHELARRRQKQTGLSKKISWALYKQKYLTRLIDDIKELLDGLESIFPQQAAYHRIAQVEVEEIGDAARLQVLADVAQDDTTLHEATQKRLHALGINTIDKAVVGEAAKVRVGNDYIVQVIGTSAGSGTNRIGELDAKGDSSVHVGDVYRVS